jgi:pyruvate dehydrogenase complex dehydrogenase (E1) component
MYTHVAEDAVTAGFEVFIKSAGHTHLGEQVVREFAVCPFCQFTNRVGYVDGRFACSHTCRHRITSDSYPSPTLAQHQWVFAPVDYPPVG